MPQAVDEAKLKDEPGKPSVVSMDLAKPPTVQIPHMEFPRVVYKHPKEPLRKIEHRNAQHEIVQIETVPAEHIAKAVNDAKELAQALKDGWVKEPYVAPAPEDPNANLYEAK